MDHYYSEGGSQLMVWYSAPPVYDPTQDQPKGVIDPLGNKTEQYFDAKGNVTKQRTQLNGYPVGRDPLHLRRC